MTNDEFFKIFPSATWPDELTGPSWHNALRDIEAMRSADRAEISRLQSIINDEMETMGAILDAIEAHENLPDWLRESIRHRHDQQLSEEKP